VRAVETLVSSSTGIVDSHSLMQFLEGRITSADTDSNVATHTKITAIGIYLFHNDDREDINYLLLKISDRKVAILWILFQGKERVKNDVWYTQIAWYVDRPLPLQPCAVVNFIHTLYIFMIG